MSQITTGFAGIPGSGTVTSIGQSTGIVLTPNPITATGTVAVVPAVALSYLTDDTLSAIPAVNVLTVAGAGGITTSSSGSTVTITGSGSGGIVWNKITIDQSALVNNGYICNKSGLLTITLPLTAAVGDIIEISGMNTDLGWKIAQNSGQTIHFGILNTTTGTGGSLSSTKKYDSVRIVCNITNTDWIVLSSIGNLTVV